MYICILFLLILPVLLLLLRWLFCWSERCMNCLATVRNLFYWNTYIRIVLESILEISIVSTLRLHNLLFNSASAIFHSVQALVFLAVLGIFLIGTCVCL